MGILETTAQILLVPPFYENLGKRLIKSPKIYLADSGLACHLLGIDNLSQLQKSHFSGAIFEGMVAAGIIKQQAGAARRREIYYFRDQQGLEVDFLVPLPGGATALVECQAGRTATPAQAVPLQRLARAFAAKHRQPEPAMFLLHQPAKQGIKTTAVAKGVKVLPWQDFIANFL